MLKVRSLLEGLSMRILISSDKLAKNKLFKIKKSSSTLQNLL